jgi:CBS domain-containing protein
MNLQGETTVGQLMTRDPVSIGAQATLVEVAELLDDHDLSGLPVVDRLGVAVGVITRSDLVRIRAAMEPWSGWHGLIVADVMTRPAVVIAAVAPVGAAAQVMSSQRIHRLIVVDDDGHPVGLLSDTDVVHEIAGNCDQ